MPKTSAEQPNSHGTMDRGMLLSLELDPSAGIECSKAWLEVCTGKGIVAREREWVKKDASTRARENDGWKNCRGGLVMGKDERVERNVRLTPVLVIVGLARPLAKHPGPRLRLRAMAVAGVRGGGNVKERIGKDKGKIWAEFDRLSGAHVDVYPRSYPLFLLPTVHITRPWALTSRSTQHSHSSISGKTIAERSHIRVSEHQPRVSPPKPNSIASGRALNGGT